MKKDGMDRNLYKLFKNSFREHREKHRLHDEFHRQMNEEAYRMQAELHQMQYEFHKKMNSSRRRYRKELQWYHRHNVYSRIFIILFNLIIWCLIFRYFGARTMAVVLAVIISISGITQIIFHASLEKRVFKPIEHLKAGVDEISKGNYDVNIKYSVSNEIGSLIDSFNEMAKRLQESEKMKAAYEENRKTLIANISHDLKTPVTSIQGYVETMLDKEDMPQGTINKYHQIIYNNAAYINKLIDDLFLFSKIDLQKLELERSRINIKAFMGDLMEEFKFELEDRQVNFEYSDLLKEDHCIDIDMKRINQVFRNIIGNAVKYGSEGSTSINVRLYEQEASICIDIEDNGPGIPEDKLPHIFDRFYRVDYARTKDLMSTGLGLAIAKELVEAHAGRIKASSVEKVGTCFTIMLPIEGSLEDDKDETGSNNRR